MIEKVHIKNFKTFRDIEIPLSPLTVIGGPNGVGKSTILEALFLFFDRRNAEMLLRQFGFRGIGKVYVSAERFFTPSFYDFADDRPIEIVIAADGQAERLTLTVEKGAGAKEVPTENGMASGSHRVRTDERPVADVRIRVEYSGPGSASEVSELVIKDKGLTLDEKNAGPRPPLISAVYVSPRTRPSPSEDADRYGELDARNEADAAVDFLKAFDHRITSVSSISSGDSSVLHAQVGLSRKVPIPFLGDGLSLMLTIFLSVAKARGGVLLVDEIGSFIHHRSLPIFWKQIASACRRFDCQLISTTHSYETLQAAAAGLGGLFEPEFSYIRLDRDGDEITPKIFSFPVFAASLESNWEVR